METSEKTKDVSVIIVNYNTKQLLKDCLTSIYEKTDGIDFEVIVSDNGSQDGSAEMCRKYFPQVRLIENNANLGFGAANNRGLDVAMGKYVFYLNSDTVLLNNAIKIFFDYFEAHAAENLGAIGCNLKDTKKLWGGVCTFLRDTHSSEKATRQFISHLAWHHKRHIAICALRF